MGKENLPGGPDNQPKTDPRQPSLSFLSETTQRFLDRGLAPSDFADFQGILGTFLAQSAQHDNLIAIGLIAIPGDQGAAELVVDRNKGVVIDVATYWSIPKSAIGEPDLIREEAKETGRHEHQALWESLAHDHPVVCGFNYYAVSTDDVSTVEAFRESLEDDRRRNEYTWTLTPEDTSEFWGMVTTEQLRSEFSAE